MFKRAIVVALALTMIAIPLAQNVYAAPKPPAPIGTIPLKFRPVVETTTSNGLVGPSLTWGACNQALGGLVDQAEENGWEVTAAYCRNDQWAIQ